MHELQVLALGVVDQGHRGAGHGCQRGNFAGVVHAQFDHGRLVRSREAQQHQRHADVVVEVALRGKGRLALPGPQDGGNHLRDGGLAVATRHADQRQSELGAPPCSQGAKRRQSVGHFNAGQPRRRDATVRQGGCGAAGLGLGQEGVGVKSLTLERDKQVAGLQGAGVGVHTGQGRGAITHQVGAGDALADKAQGLLKGHHAHVLPPRACSAARAWAMSENGRRTPATSW